MAILDPLLMTGAMIPEATWGTVNNAVPAQAFRFGKLEPTFKQESKQAEEHRDDGTEGDMVRVKRSAEVSIEAPDFYGNLHPFYPSILQDTPVVINIADAIQFVAAGTKATRTVGSFITDGVRAGMWIYSNKVGSANNGFHNVATVVSATELTLRWSTATITDEAAAVRDFKMTNVRHGVTKKSCTIQKNLGNGEFYVYAGSRGQKMSRSFKAADLGTASLSFLSKGEVIQASSIGSGTTTAAPQNPPNSSGFNITALREGGVLLPAVVTEFGFDYERTLEEQIVVTSQDLAGVGVHTGKCTGKLMAYYEDKTLYEKHKNWTISDFSARLVDDLGNIEIHTADRLRFHGGKVMAESKKAILVEMLWTAIPGGRVFYGIDYLSI